MNHFLKTILVAAALGAISQSAPAAGTLLVVSKQTQTLAIVDGQTLKVTAHVPVGANRTR